MARIGIIRCQEHSNQCAGYHWFPAMRDRTGQSEGYEAIEVVGFDTCGGCAHNRADKIVARAVSLKERGAEVIHLGNCLTGACPFKGIYLDPLKEEVKLPIIERTHQ